LRPAGEWNNKPKDFYRRGREGTQRKTGKSATQVFLFMQTCVEENKLGVVSKFKYLSLRNFASFAVRAFLWLFDEV